MQTAQMTAKNKQSENKKRADQVKLMSSAVCQFAHSKLELIDHCQLQKHPVKQQIISHQENQIIVNFMVKVNRLCIKAKKEKQLKLFSKNWYDFAE